MTAWTLYSWKRRFGAMLSVDPIRDSRATRRADLVEVGPLPAVDPIELVVATMTVRVPPMFVADEFRRLLEVVRAC